MLWLQSCCGGMLPAIPGDRRGWQLCLLVPVQHVSLRYKAHLHESVLHGAAWHKALLPGLRPERLPLARGLQALRALHRQHNVSAVRFFPAAGKDALFPSLLWPQLWSLA